MTFLIFYRIFPLVFTYPPFDDEANDEIKFKSSRWFDCELRHLSPTYVIFANGPHS